MIWPDNFPPNCPSSDSSETRGRYYRLVKRNPLDLIDFSPSNQKPDESYDDPECIKCGISLCNSLSGIKKHREWYTWKKDYYIAKVDFEVGMGKIKKTPPSSEHHYTWWLPKDFNPLPIFEVIVEKDGEEK